MNSPRADLSFDRRDSAPGMVKAVVTDESFNWADDRPPNVPWSDTVIYEAHLRGLTMLCEDIRPNARGTFAALAEPKIIDHLRRLGITTIELLPIHAFVQDRFLGFVADIYAAQKFGYVVAEHVGQAFVRIIRRPH